jgi:NADH:ubiquinone oxidoreductase subunit 6 (subunit J)
MTAAEFLLNAVFYVLAAAAVGGAVAVATSRNIVRSAFALLTVLFSVAALYAVMKADFIAAAQVLIYVGGILVLIIFAVMLTHKITDVKLSNDSTPGPAAFCACLCLLFSLVVVVLFTAKWRRDAEPVTVRGDGFEVAMLQYQADGGTGLALGGATFEDSVELVVEVKQIPDPSRIAEQVVITAVPAKGEKKTKSFPFAGKGSVYRHSFDKLAEGEWHWSVHLAGKEKDAKGVETGREWKFPPPSTGKPDFIVYRGVTQTVAMALAGPYLLAFEVVSVLLLAALVGAAFLARKEVREA